MVTKAEMSAAVTPRALLDIPDAIDRYAGRAECVEVLPQCTGPESVQLVEDRATSQLDAVTGEEHRHLMAFLDGCSGDQERERRSSRCFRTVGDVYEEFAHHGI